jgi:hypothetical protein
VAYSREQIGAFLRSAGWPEAVISIMTAIGLAEQPATNPNFVRVCPGNSYCLPGQSPEKSVGPFQINVLAHAQYNTPQGIAWLQDPTNNARAALQIFRSQGLRAWGSYTDGRYRQYLTPGANDPSPAGNLGISPDQLPGLSSVGDIFGGARRYFFEEQTPSPADRFAPYLKQRSVTPQGRATIATVIVIVILAFVWREF